MVGDQLSVCSSVVGWDLRACTNPGLALQGWLVSGMVCLVLSFCPCCDSLGWAWRFGLVVWLFVPFAGYLTEN